MIEVVSFPSREELCVAAARDISSVIAECINEHGDAHIVVTGGSTGIATLAALADCDVEWARVHVYFGDERDVPVSDPESNEGQAREALLNYAERAGATIHGCGLGSGDLDAAAERYAGELPSRIDVHLLGMGHEGHINSLFPGSAALRESTRSVVAVKDSPKPPARRITLTVPTVRSARRVWFLVAGADKRAAVAHLVEGADPLEWPACSARGSEHTRLYGDADALGYTVRR